MSEHGARIHWERGEDDFARGRYSRAHQWRFDGGALVLASASPAVVPEPWADPAGVDPEEALVAALSSCHMLWFLSLAADRGFVVESYDDAPVGTMTRIARERSMIGGVVLRPRAVFGGTTPTQEALDALHHDAHERCFIANSVKSTIRIEPRA